MYTQSAKYVKQKTLSQERISRSKIHNGSPDEGTPMTSTLEAHVPLKVLSCFPFSKGAKDLLRRKRRKYIIQLISDSTKFAKRQGVDEVSAIHVEQASINLTHNTSRRFFKHIGTLGGILLGASLSALLAMISTNRYSPASILIPAGVGIIGAFMIAFHIAKDSS